MRISFNTKDANAEIAPEEVKNTMLEAGTVNMLECYKSYPLKFIRAVAREEDYMIFHYDENLHEVCLNFPTYKDLVNIIDAYALGKDWKEGLPEWETIN